MTLRNMRGHVRMAIAIQINLALWGMLICAEIKLAQLVL
jgi:hypothetical protein